MRKLLLTTVVALLAFATAAHAGEVTIGTVTVTQVKGLTPGTFDDDAVGAMKGNSTALTSAGLTVISFFTDGAVEKGSKAGVYAAPAGDQNNYLYGVNALNPEGKMEPLPLWSSKGATVYFLSANREKTIDVDWFYIYWCSAARF